MKSGFSSFSSPTGDPQQRLEGVTVREEDPGMVVAMAPVEEPGQAANLVIVLLPLDGRPGAHPKTSVSTVVLRCVINRSGPGRRHH